MMSAIDLSDQNIDFQKHVRWTTVAVVTLTAATLNILQPYLSNFRTPGEVWIAQGLLLIMVCWTILIPSYKWSPSVRFVALIGEILVIFAASSFGIPRFFYFIYMCIVAKAACQLENKGLVLIMLAVFGAHIGVSNLVQERVHQNFVVTAETTARRLPLLLHIEVQLYFVLCMCVVAAMTKTMIAERVNRLRAQRLSEEIEELAVRYERARISRDIHDNLGHTLTSLGIQLEVAKTLYNKDEVVAKKALAAAKELADNSLTDVRRSVYMIREQDGAPFDLESALTALVNRAKSNHHLNIDLTLNTPSLPVLKAHNIFCIVQEALTNAQRHSDADSVQITLDRERENVMHLVVKDNGKGFDHEKSSNGVGITSMHERADSLGGKLAIVSTPGDGTTISIEFPLSGAVL